MPAVTSLRDAEVVRFLADAAGAVMETAVPSNGQFAMTAESARVAAFLAGGIDVVALSTPNACAGSGISLDSWSQLIAPRVRGASFGPNQGLSLAEAETFSSWTSALALRAKLDVPYGDDGAPPDSETQATVDEINETIAEGPDEGQSWESWQAEVEALVDELQGPDPCPTFNPPSTGECPLVGLPDCSPPCIYEQPSGCDIDMLPFEEAQGLYDLIYGIADPDVVPDWEPVDLVQYAWALLLDNLDLVAWTACLSYGETTQDTNILESFGELFGVAGSVPECLTEKIEGKQPDVTINFVANTDSGSFATSTNALSGGTIFIPDSGSNWQTRYVAKYKNAVPGSAEEFCIVADLAATLLHELVHSCVTAGSADNPGGDDDQNACSTSYLIENNFRWAIGQRYPCLCATSNCDFYYDSRLWRNDGASWPGDPPFPPR